MSKRNLKSIRNLKLLLPQSISSRIIIGVFVFIFILLLLAMVDLLAQRVYYNRVIAEVDQEQLSRSEFEDRVQLACGPNIMEEMILEELIDQEIQKEKISIDQDEIDEEIERSIQLFGNEDDFWAELEANNLNRDDLEDRIATSLAIGEIVKADIINPTQEEIDQYYQEHLDDPELSVNGLTNAERDRLIEQRLFIIKLEEAKLDFPTKIREDADITNYYQDEPTYSLFGYFRLLLRNR